MSALPDTMRLSRYPRVAPTITVEELRRRIYDAGRVAVEEVRRRNAHRERYASARQPEPEEPTP